MNLYLSAPHGCYCQEAMNLYLAGTYTRPFAVEPMNVHLAGVFPCDSKLKGALGAGEVTSPHFTAGAGPLKILESFYYIADWMLPHIKGKAWDFLLDSGAFTFMQQGGGAAVDWDGYIEKYAAFITANDVQHFFELDIDAVVGLPRVHQLRAKLERLTGRQCIPVWHHARGKDYWLGMVRDYPYVALGGMAADREYRRRLEPMFPWFLSTSRAAGSKVHALGYTSIEGMTKYPFHSVDSTAWLYGNRGGYLYHFNGQTVVKVTGPPGARLKGREAAIHNFSEWVKFQRYAEQYL